MSEFAPTALIPLTIGVVLLLWGRKLYWLALAVLGFLVGRWLAGEVVHLESPQLTLAISLLLGIVGAVLAIFAQKIAVRLGGSVVGGGMAFWLAAPHVASLGFWLWLLVAAGAIVGVILASFVFSAALITVSSLSGARLLAQLCCTNSPREVWVLFILFALGVILQARASVGTKDD